tara:strand:+ start:8352 stop:9206 length:855 start_codon:yes stop_codon:yes gene_type:complete
MSYKNVTGVSKKNNTQGVSEAELIDDISDLHYESIVRNGFSIIKDVFSENICQTAKQKIDQIYSKQIKECGDENYLSSINENDICRAPIVYDEFFSQFIINQKIKDILNVAFGDKYILNLQNCPINRAKNKHFGSTWHRDLSYQHFIPSRPIAITALVCLDEFTEDNGGTSIIPYSHKFEKFPSEIYVKENEKKIKAKLGDVVMFDALTFHRAGENNTNEDRNLIVQVFTLPFIKQQISLPKALNGKFSENDDLSYVLGYETEVEESILSWRRRRKKRYQKIEK